MRLQLVIRSRLQSQEVTLDSKRQELVPVGRMVGAAGIAIASNTVSGHHLDVVHIPQSGGWCIVDQGSTNGTFYQSSRLVPGVPSPLSKKGSIFLGQEVVVHFSQEEFNGTGDNRIQSLLAAKGELTIGRGDGADIQLANPRVSRRHARVYERGGQTYVEDLGSRNGTFLDGKPLSGRVEWKPGAILTIGLHQFQLDVDGRTRIGDLSTEVALRAEGISKSFPTKGGVPKCVLQTLDVEFGRGKMIGLMGPSGCGKSTLLKTLLGELKSSSGQVYHNGLELNTHFEMLSRQVGYVPQDDVLHADLTLDQTMSYAGELRNPPGTDKQRIRAKYEAVLKSLDIHSPDLRTKKISELSGGQRKRVAIAIELLRDPQFLFLDEPTSPLDPESIKEFLTTVKELTQRGITVVLVTHKPGDRKYLDQVVFLGKSGYLCYSGDPHQLEAHFGVEEIEEVYRLLSDEANCKMWNDKIPQSAGAKNDLSQDRRSQASTIGSVRQFGVFSRRYAAIKLAKRGALLFSLLQPLVIGILMMLVYDTLLKWDTNPLTQEREMNGELGALFLVVVSAIWFGISNSAKEIVGERSILRRENFLLGTIQPYLLSKYAVLGVLTTLQVSILMGLVAFGIDGLEEVGWSLMPVVVTGLVSVGFGLVLSSWAKNVEAVMSNLPLALIPQILFSGVITPIAGDGAADSMASWLSHIMMSRWGMELFANIQDEAAGAHPYGKVLLQSIYGDGWKDPEVCLELEVQWAFLIALFGAFYVLTYLGIRKQLLRS